jgi:hypothetical protein
MAVKFAGTDGYANVVTATGGEIAERSGGFPVSDDCTA